MHDDARLHPRYVPHFSRRALLAIGAGVAVGALPLASATAAPRLPDRIRVRDAAGSIVTVEFEEYIKAVVATEMPVSWPAEALKAQAVAARTYALAYLAKHGYVCSTTDCQVWNPARRHPRPDAAGDATRGLVLLYHGSAIWAHYSSTCGGVTAAGSLPYLRSVRCWLDASGPVPMPDLAAEAAAVLFWGAERPPGAFCDRSPSYRYRWSLDGSALAAVLDRHLAAVAGVTPRYNSGALGTLRDLAVVARAGSGKVSRLRIAGRDGVWEVSGETSLRSVLRPAAAAPPQRSANVVLAVSRDGFGVARLDGRGGGFGHGIGMCQFGARGMAERGFDYRAILTHYYRDVEVAAL